ncbi:hypothetical protein OIO90_005252 [Microbotryomycetes sp. JL221]|nr:hypothetical protein OIO90_005252 [Microbotryomycetes sp. JL221]
MATAHSLRNSFNRIAQAWPKDVLRPTMQFSAAISNASDRILFATPSNRAPSDISENAQSQTAQMPKQLTADELRKAEATVEALDRLLGDQALKRYPMGPKTTHPPSFPKHYERILEGAQKARRGEVVKSQRWRQFFQWK